MKDEETDWLIYHLIPNDTQTTPEYLILRSGLDSLTVTASLRRLEQAMLIDRKDGKIHILPINESLIRCQIRYDSSLPYTIENGIIRDKKRQDS